MSYYSEEINSNLSHNISAITEGLNPEQKSAVEIINGPILVLAGAGSGKTRVLTNRIAYLIEKSINPYNILALTFTNKAANEMKERISRLVHYRLAKNIWAGTFHSVFARILRIEAENIGYQTNFSIYDQDDSLSVVKNIMKDSGYSSAKLQPANVRGVISSNKNKMISWQEFERNASNAIERQIADIFREYETVLLKNNAMDFDDLLLNFIILLKKSKELLNKYQQQFKYILVDEYQDTNKAQYIAIQMLAKAHQNICVVGDDAQSIYRWRGAEIQNILDFQKDYPYSKIVRLEQNYRSTKTILAAAHAVISNNSKQIAKKLWTDNPDGDLIEVLACNDDREEARKVADLIQKMYNSGRNLKDFAVLYRTNAQSLALETSLRAANLPYIIVGGVSFYKRKEIKDVLAYIRILMNNRDAESLLRIVNEPPRGLGQTSINHLKEFAKEYDKTLYEVFQNADRVVSLQNRAAQSAKSFIEFLNKYRSLLNDLPVYEVITEYINATGILDMYRQINTEDSLDRWNNINQLLFDIKQFFINNPESTIEDYVQQISLVADIDEKDLHGNAITLMTLHSAKGLEYPCVFITGIEKGLFPLTRMDFTKDEEEEERRLFYVGITRAKEKLFLSYALRRAKFGDVQTSVPSPFLREIPDNLTKYGLKAKTQTSNEVFLPQKAYTGNPFQKPVPKPVVKSSYSQIPDAEQSYSQIPVDDSSFNVGDKVHHSQFGKGTISAITGVGQSKKATVIFNSVGPKQLILQYAKLQKF